ncbi:hypothetical protein RLEG12_08985 (plasmid) [Rhizobium leguminosarum bv. trifolii CB782]|nr:hypothetical protein RLEG12_08985 [Rhizobium leguminosarum bv. trifolii CB782]
MCNDYEQHIRYAEYCKMMQALDLGISDHQGEADLSGADDIRIGERGPVVRANGNVVELAQMTFGFPPKGRGGPVFNFRSEGRDFSDSQRCLVLASAFTMLTTTPGPDVAPIHDRQVVVLAPRRWADWIYLSGPESDVLAPLPAGSLRVDQVRSGSD